MRLEKRDSRLSKFDFQYANFQVSIFNFQLNQIVTSRYSELKPESKSSPPATMLPLASFTVKWIRHKPVIVRLRVPR